MELIIHERQEGFLCAQHCLNALLQGSYFTPVDLATLGQKMDDEERIRMAESGIDSEDYQKFLKQPSGNMDDSGFFSVQVISSALEVWGLELVPYFSSDPIATDARRHPERMQAYICNFKQHWLTIRKIGSQWFNLNSLLTGPELLSDTYLGLFLAQLQNDGYSIFIVIGSLPSCQADDYLKRSPVVQLTKPTLVQTEPSPSVSTPSARNLPPSYSNTATSSAPYSRPSDPVAVNADEADDIQRAINLSLGIDEFAQPLCESESPSTDTPANSSSSSSSIPIQVSQESTSSSNHVAATSASSTIRHHVSQSVSRSCYANELLTRENSTDEELENAIRLSLEPFQSDSSPAISLNPSSNVQ